MTIRGRPPKPTALKVLNGNPGKRPLNQLEPKPKPHLPKCPAWLDPAAKKEWRRVVPELKRIGYADLRRRRGPRRILPILRARGDAGYSLRLPRLQELHK